MASMAENVENYLGNGGRALFSHYSYVWLFQTSPLSSVATWNVNQSIPPSQEVGFVGAGAPSTFASWLVAAAASTASGQVIVDEPRVDTNGVSAGTNLWLSASSLEAGAPLKYSAAVPDHTSGACGRLHYLEYNALTTTNLDGGAFPTECAATAATPAERAIEFTLFDVFSCP